MRGNLWDDPRVAAIVDATDTSEATVIGALYWLWATADDHTEDGMLQGMTVRQVDRKTGIPGFAQAVADIGWIEVEATGVRIVRFDEHNGASAKRRASESRRKVSARDADKMRTSGGHDEDAGRNGCGSSAHLEEEREEEVEGSRAESAIADSSPQADAFADDTGKVEGNGVPRCPQKAIVALYHEILPELAPVREWTDARARALGARWREKAERQSLTWWREYFEYVKTSDFLMGKVAGRSGRPFMGCNLEWLVTPSKMTNVIEGRYENSAPGGAA